MAGMMEDVTRVYTEAIKEALRRQHEKPDPFLRFLQEDGRGKLSKVVFSKKSDEWSTPDEFFKAWDAAFKFGHDAAATRDNKKCISYFGPDHPVAEYRDALAVSWCFPALNGGLRNVWCNPPYSMCKEFVAKAAAERLKGVTTVMLIPSRTDTRWFHAHLWDEAKGDWREGIQGHFVRGRLKFGGSKNSAPFPSMVVVFEGVRM